MPHPLIKPLLPTPGQYSVQPQPLVINQSCNIGLALNNCLNALPWRIDQYREAKRLMAPVEAIVHRLQWQANTQICAIPFYNTKVSTNH